MGPDEQSWCSPWATPGSTTPFLLVYFVPSQQTRRRGKIERDQADELTETSMTDEPNRIE